MSKLMSQIVLSNGETFPLTDNELKIGAMADICDIVIEDPRVSPFHCEIIPEGDGWAVRELQSNLGLLLDGEEVEKGSTTPLHNGAAIQIADEILTFEEVNVTFFTDDERTMLDDYAAKALGKEAVSPEEGQAVIDLLAEKIAAVADACGIEIEAAETAEIAPEAATAPDMEDAAETIAEPEVQAIPEEQAAQPDMPEALEDRKKPEDQLDETKIFEKPDIPADDTQAATICFLVPTPETTQQFKERAICVKRVPYKIGAAPANDYVMANTFRISPEHAQIVDNPSGGFMLQNKDTSFGTYINGRLVNPEQMVPFGAGDVITFGTHAYRVESV